MELSDLFKPSNVPHYYGDYVRLLFLAAALVMLLNLPQFLGYLTMPPVYSIVTIVLLAVAAGFTNPKQTLSATLNLIISISAFIIFDIYTVMTYQNQQFSSYFFYINMLLSIIFLFALYFSVKTLRSKLLKNPTPPQQQ